MDYYIYNADVYCSACATDIKRRIKAEDGPRTTEDSDEWPQFVDQESNSSDSPQHCGSGEHCLNPHVFPSGFKAGAFLENDLTSYGRDYVKEMHADGPSEVTAFWVEFYNLERECNWCDNKLPIDAPDDQKQCAECIAADEAEELDWSHIDTSTD
jgi:hypothetical protein